jgi:hypothetical protein
MYLLSTSSAADQDRVFLCGMVLGGKRIALVVYSGTKHGNPMPPHAFIPPIHQTRPHLIAFISGSHASVPAWLCDTVSRFGSDHLRRHVGFLSK